MKQILLASLAVAATFAVTTPAFADLALATSKNCMACHAIDKTVHFVITDVAHDIPVAYTGILPDLFKEGKGAVVQGYLGGDGQFTASEVLAKHDENYMPPEAKHALDEAQANKGTVAP